MLQLFLSNPVVGLIIFGILIMSLAIHEASHAFSANYLGDDTPRRQGRLTLNPLAHLDLLGTILLLVVGFGWGKPVIVNPFNFKNPKRDMMIVSFAGPLSNILLAIISAVIIKYGINYPLITGIFNYVMYINIVLAVFNLLPIYPLDGSKVLEGLLPYNLSVQFAETSRYGIYILLILLVFNAFNIILNPLVNTVMTIIAFAIGIPNLPS